MIKHRDSHVELPQEFGTVPCGLWGPAVGDPPVGEADVVAEVRGSRSWTSRLVDRPMRPTRTVTVVAGPHDGHACVLYTAFGGPATPQEPEEPEEPGCKDVAVSAAFWRDHALAR